MKTEELLKWAVIAGIAYFVYDALKKNPITKVTADWIADFYLWLTLPGSMELQGEVVLPNGDTFHLSEADIREKGGVVVAAYGGHFYQLSPHDEDGNWPGVLIL